MSRTMRYAVLVLAVASVNACSNSVTEPTPAQNCVAQKNGTAQSCAWLDYINPKV